jgi:hypothetical protein
MFVQMQDLTQDDWHRIVALYDGEIAFTDAAVAELLEGLDERNLLDNTLIVFLSDHGEEFFEHGGFEHGHSLYDELIHVPLFFCLPGRLPGGARLSRPVRLLDVAPTILDFVDIEPPTDFEGVSIRPLLEGEGQRRERGGGLVPQDVAYAEALMHGRERKCVMAYPWKLVYEMGTETEDLFNLAEDPREMENLMAENPAKVSELNDLLFGALFGMSDTWYMEMAAGENRGVFDIDVVAEKGPMPGSINPLKALGKSGDVIELPGEVSLEGSGSRLRVRNLNLKGSLTLAFKVHPSQCPVDFDFRIGGLSALEQTFLGESLTSAEEMPFSVKARRTKVKSPGRPDLRPEPPYIMVWYEESGYQGETRARLDEETKKELRALGYIQ